MSATIRSDRRSHWTRLAPEAGRLSRFCGVGVSNTAITLTTYYLLVRAGSPGWAASAFAFAAGALNGFHWNARWTFAGCGDRAAATRARYVAVQGAGSALSAIGVLGAQDVLHLAHVPAELVVLPLVTVMMYSLMLTIVFPVRGVDQRPTSA